LIFFKLETPPKDTLAPALDLPSAAHPKTHSLATNKEKKKILSFADFFGVLNL
jgi:hypothetical protein